MITFYVDVPYGYNYRWNEASRVGIKGSAPLVLEWEFGYKTEFICNDAAKISKGDCYGVTCNNPAEKDIYLLKTGFNLINKELVEDYIYKRGRKS